MIKLSTIRATIILCGMASLAACVSAPTPPPPAPPPPAPVTPEPVADNWRDWPVAAGNWSYLTTKGGTIAAFGQPGQPTALSFRCDLASRRIFVARATTQPATEINGQMAVHTSFGIDQWPITPHVGAGAPIAYATAIRASNDTSFDRIAFSRGRFAIEAPGAQPLSVPSWAEVSRVIEDCRG